MSDKNLILISGPEDHGPGSPGWPVPPIYEPLWDWQRIDDELWKCCGDNGRFSDNLVQALCEQIAADYDKLCSELQFHLWQCEGIKKIDR